RSKRDWSSDVCSSDLDRIRAGCRAGVKIVWTLSLPLCLLYFFAGRPLMYFFIDEPSADALSTGVIFLRILSPFYFVVSAKLVFEIGRASCRGRVEVWG